MRNHLKLLFTNLRSKVKDKSGSASIEFVYGAAMCCVLILSVMMIIGYALQFNEVSYAGKRIARYVEIKGTATDREIDALLNELLPNADEINASCTVTPENNWFSESLRKIQLREKFTVSISATYSIPVMSTGNRVIYLNMPIKIGINGQSEAYWK